MFDLEVEWRSFWVTLTCSSRNNDFKTGGYLEHDFTTMSSEIQTFRTSATNRYLHQQTRDTVSRAQHTTQKEVIDLWSGFWTCGSIVVKVSRASVSVPSKSGLCGDTQRSLWSKLSSNDRSKTELKGSVRSTTATIDVVWTSTWKQVDQMSSNSASMLQRKRDSDYVFDVLCMSQCLQVWKNWRMIRLFQNTKICLPICQLEMISVLQRWISMNLLMDTRSWRFLLSFCTWLEQRSIRHKKIQVVSFHIRSCFWICCLRVRCISRWDFSVSYNKFYRSKVFHNQIRLIHSSLKSTNSINMRRRITRKRVVVLPQHTDLVWIR